MSWYWGNEYTSRKPKKVKGGIKAQSKRGAFGESWWAKRWNETLEGYNMGARLNRGKTYARKGQVASIKIQKGRITATVQGSWEYKVRINISTLTKDQWSDIARGIFESPATAAALLAGQMPNDIEDIFEKYKIRLFPGRKNIKSECTCPDWSNPCKHIAAVYLLLAEEFDRDPFLIFRLRGIERKEILEMGGINNNKTKEKKDKQEIQTTQSTDDKSDKIAIKKNVIKKKKRDVIKKKREDIVKPIDPSKFWGDLEEQIVKYDNSGDNKRDNNSMNAEIPTIPAVLLKQIGGFPFWRGEKNFMDIMEEIYTKASNTGTEVFLGEYANKSTSKRNK